jgi:hypothetical protein
MRLKQNIEQVREVATTRQSAVGSENDLSIGDVLRQARRQLMTKRILTAIVVILLITIVLFFALTGGFGDFVDYLISLAE